MRSGKEDGDTLVENGEGETDIFVKRIANIIRMQYSMFPFLMPLLLYY